ncbi:MAG: glycosyltransferase family 4 protein [Candidatus Binatia bacterium]
MTPLRIGYYFCLPVAMGGVERHVLALIDHFRSSHHITVFCDAADAAHPFRAELSARGFEPRLIRLGGKDLRGVARPLAKNIAEIFRALRALAPARLDVLHLHAGRLGLAYAPIAAAGAAGIPRRVLTVHNTVARRSPWQRFFEARALARLDRIVAVSVAVKNDLTGKKAVATDKIVVIPNGVDAAEFSGSEKERRDARAALGLPERSAAVGMVGRLHAMKGADLLIRAAALIRARAPHLRVALIGTGPEEAALKRLAEELRVSDIVSFAGYRSDARRLMHAFDVLAIPSRQDAQPFSLLEGMACGKPVVGANVGDIPGMLVDGVTGLLFPAGDFTALAAALAKLLGDPQKRTELGCAGRRRVESHFSQAAMLERTEALYRRPVT